MKIVAVTACPTGIAHTYMAADLLQKEAHRLGLSIKVETQGAMGIENTLTVNDIANSDIQIIVSDIKIEGIERFHGCRPETIPIETVLLDVNSVLTKYLD